MSIQFTISKVTLSYQYIYIYIYALCYREMHLLEFIGCYCTFIYTKYVIQLCFIINHQKNLLMLQMLNQFIYNIL